MSLYLASQSPRRRELLASLGVKFDIRVADIDETPIPGESPEDYVLRLAIEKAQAGQSLIDSAADDDWVLGSDTAVIVDGQILGKPEDEADFIRMMGLLSGREHIVLTSLALVSAQQSLSTLVATSVRFFELSDELIQHYWQTGEPADKAGGYGIQGLGSVLVETISGSYSAVVGLPLHETAKLLGQAGLPIWQGAVRL